MNNNEKNCNALLQKAFEIDNEISDYLSIIHSQNLYRISGGSLVFPKQFNKTAYFDNISRILNTEEWNDFKKKLLPNKYIVTVYKQIEGIKLNHLITFMNSLSYKKDTEFSISYITEKISNLNSARKQNLNNLVEKIIHYMNKISL